MVFKRPNMARCLHSSAVGNLYDLLNIYPTESNTKPARKKRIFARTNGGDDKMPNFVATDAEAHSIANSNPIKIFFINKQLFFIMIERSQ